MRKKNQFKIDTFLRLQSCIDRFNNGNYLIDLLILPFSLLYEVIRSPITIYMFVVQLGTESHRSTSFDIIK